ncbi:kelch-like protein 24 [Anneissia japonica]|uniref:kelch-like protein 24 n=1 Tax=Anneissia japonica TaxID=1529436 RepID=UPI00142599F5|nr:kelch-like protein 24 [Anneissia japonica]
MNTEKDDVLQEMVPIMKNDFFLLHIPSKSSKVLSSLNEMRSSAECIDLVIRVDAEQIPCHRAILAASSHYFKSMFTNNLIESEQNTITLLDISPDSVKALVEFSYTSKIYIHKDTVEDLFETAMYLQYETVSSACVEFMIGRLQTSNCIHYYKFAQTFNCIELLEAAKTFILTNFSYVSTTSEFFDMSCIELVDILSNDRLKVDSESDLVDAILRWIEFDNLSRNRYLTKLLDEVRLALLDDSYLRILEKWSEDSASCLSVSSLIDEAMCCKTLIHKGYRVMGRHTTPRSHYTRKDFLVLVGGHRNEFDDGYTYSESVLYTEIDNGKLGSWKSLNNLPDHEKRKYSVTAKGWSIIVTGGYDAGIDQSIADTWQFNFPTNEWNRLADMNVARHSHGSTTLNDSIYVVGGKSTNQENRLNDVEVFKPFQSEWHTCPALPTAVSVAAVVSCQQKIYVVGGANDYDSPASLIQCLDPETNTWTVLNDFLVCRKIPQALTLRNEIIVVGARKPREVISYNPETKECRKLANCNQQRTFSAAVSSKGKMWLLGGKLSGEAHSSIDCYDERTNSWSTLRQNLPNALYMIGGVVLPADS